jgi:hypothetical protein
MFRIAKRRLAVIRKNIRDPPPRRRFDIIIQIYKRPPQRIRQPPPNRRLAASHKSNHVNCLTHRQPTPSSLATAHPPNREPTATPPPTPSPS